MRAETGEVNYIADIVDRQSFDYSILDNEQFEVSVVLAKKIFFGTMFRLHALGLMCYLTLLVKCSVKD